MGLSVLRRLEKVGFAITPYYLFEEEVAGKARLEQDENLSYEIIDPSMVEPIAAEFPDEKRVWIETWNRRLSEGELGLLARYDGEIAGFCWANMEACTRPSGKFLLTTEEDQCWLHDMVVATRFRGKKLAPMIREAQFKLLVERGIARGVSASMYFNKPAIRFKQKLNARILELRCEVILFRRFDFDFGLRKYKAA